VDSPFGSFELIGVHIPTYGRPNNRVLKVETQEGLLKRMAKLNVPTLLCGDFNSPLREEADGTVIPFARRRGSRQREAEAGLMGATNSCGLTDLFRACHGYTVDGHSWWWKNRGRTGGYRLDHVFASCEFSVKACDYIHEWRTDGLSDHSAIYADVILHNGA
jgi:exonuclease III